MAIDGTALNAKVLNTPKNRILRNTLFDGCSENWHDWSSSSADLFTTAGTAIDANMQLT